MADDKKNNKVEDKKTKKVEDKKDNKVDLGRLEELMALQASKTQMTTEQLEEMTKLLSDAKSQNKKDQTALDTVNNQKEILEEAKSIRAAQEKLTEESKDEDDTEKDNSKTLNDIAKSVSSALGITQRQERRAKRKIDKVNKKGPDKADTSGGFDLKGLMKLFRLDGIVKFFETFGKIVKTIKNVVSKIGGFTVSGMAAAFSIVIVVVSAIKHAFLRLKKAMGDKDATWWDKMSAVLAGIFEGVTMIPAKIIDFFKGLTSKALKFLFGEDNAVSKFLDSFSFAELTTKLSDFIEQGLKDVGKFMGEAIDSAVEWVKNLISWEELKKDILADGLFPAIGARITEVFSKLDEWFTEKGAALSKTLDDAFLVVKETFTNLWEGVQNFFTSIDAWFVEKGAALSKTLDDAFLAVKKVFTDLWEGVTGWISGVVKSVDEVFENIAGIFNSAGEWLEETFSWENIKEALSVTVDKVKSFLMNMGGLFTSIGEWLVESFSWENIKSSIGSISDIISNAAQGLADLVKEGLAWMAGKLKFWDSSTDEEKEEKRVEKEQKKAAKQEKKDKKKFEKEMKSSGVIDKVDTNIFGGGGREVISEDKMKDLTNAQLEGLLDYSADTGNYEMQEQLLEEGSRREQLRKDHTGFEHWSDAALGDVINKQQSGQAGEILGTPEVSAKAMQEWEKRESLSSPDSSSANLGSAVQPQTVNAIDEKYANPAKISGLGQESIAQSQEMQVSQASYDQNKGPVQSQGNVNTSVNAPTTNNSTVNNSYIQGNQPSTRDTSDQMYIFRATGTSR